MGNSLYAPCGWAAGPACWLDALADASLALLLPLGCCACCRGAQRLLEYISLSSCALQGPRGTMHSSVQIVYEMVRCTSDECVHGERTYLRMLLLLLWRRHGCGCGIGPACRGGGGHRSGKEAAARGGRLN
jgi:hypothetical protein